MPSPLILPSSHWVRPDRTPEINQFLDSIGWGNAERSHLAGDASFRRYERVVDVGRHAVLMDAPPPFEDVKPFVHVTGLLANAGLSVPSIIGADVDEGFLLLEDLGDASYSRVLRNDVSHEEEFYLAAMDALLMLQQRVNPENIAPYDAAVYLREVALFSDWFLPQVLGLSAAQSLRSDYLEIWGDILAQANLGQGCMVHRDYHADNLLWLADRKGAARVGMIDYQDALVGSPLYDVVSLLEDARRDVSEATVDSAFRRFVNAAGMREEHARQHFAVLGAQRNLKIIGIFTRLAVRDGKPHYLGYLPRVWGHLMRDLSHPAMAALRTFIDQHTPPSVRGAIGVDVSIGSLHA